jgi:hypothetical protein
MEGVAYCYNKTNGHYAVRLDRGEGEEPINVYIKPDNLSEVVEHPPLEAAIPAVDIETASCSSSTTTVNAKQSETEILSIMALKLLKDFGFPEIAVPVAEKSLEVSRCTKPNTENRINTHTHTHTQAHTKKTHKRKRKRSMKTARQDVQVVMFRVHLSSQYTSHFIDQLFGRPPSAAILRVM